MKRVLPFVFLLLVAPLAWGQATPVKPIRFPDIVTPPTPPVPVNPTTPIPLSSDYLYVVDSDIDLLAFSFPPGILKITKATGPTQVFGKFVGGSGTHEIKSFSGKSLLIVTANGNGAATLLVMPVGAKTEAEAIQKQFAVTTSPDPPKPPDPPDPIDPPTPSAKVSFVIVFEETAERTPAIARVLGDLAGWQSLGVQWRHIDKDDEYAKSAASQAAIAKVGLPCMVLLGDKGTDGNRPVIKIMKLPGTMAEVRKEIGK